MGLSTGQLIDCFYKITEGEVEARKKDDWDEGRKERWRNGEKRREKKKERGREDGRSWFLEPQTQETSKRLKEHNHQQGMDLF